MFVVGVNVGELRQGVVMRLGCSVRRVGLVGVVGHSTLKTCTVRFVGVGVAVAG